MVTRWVKVTELPELFFFANMPRAHLATIQVIQVFGSTSSLFRLRLTSTTTCWVRCQLSEDHPWSNYHEVTHGCEIEPARPGRFQTSDALKLGRPEMVSKTEKEKMGHRCWQVWICSWVFRPVERVEQNTSWIHGHFWLYRFWIVCCLLWSAVGSENSQCRCCLLFEKYWVLPKGMATDTVLLVPKLTVERLFFVKEPQPRRLSE